MKPVYIFYHFFSKPESDWTWVLDQQLQMIKTSDLKFAQVNMCITGDIDLDYDEDDD